MADIAIDLLGAVSAVVSLSAAIFFATTAGSFYEAGKHRALRFSLAAAFGLGLFALFQARYIHG